MFCASSFDEKFCSVSKPGHVAVHPGNLLVPLSTEEPVQVRWHPRSHRFCILLSKSVLIVDVLDRQVNVVAGIEQLQHEITAACWSVDMDSLLFIATAKPSLLAFDFSTSSALTPQRVKPSFQIPLHSILLSKTVSTAQNEDSRAACDSLIRSLHQSVHLHFLLIAAVDQCLLLFDLRVRLNFGSSTTPFAHMPFAYLPVPFFPPSLSIATGWVLCNCSLSESTDASRFIAPSSRVINGSL